MRPSLSDIAAQRALATKLLAENPKHELAPMLRVFLGATAPPTLDEALPIMVRHANNLGEWPNYSSDVAAAKTSIVNQLKDSWSVNVRAQYATLRHFFGGAE